MRVDYEVDFGNSLYMESIHQPHLLLVNSTEIAFFQEGCPLWPLLSNLITKVEEVFKVLVLCLRSLVETFQALSTKLIEKVGRIIQRLSLLLNCLSKFIILVNLMCNILHRRYLFLFFYR